MVISKRLLFVLFTVLSLVYSCKTPQDITYFQDTNNGTITKLPEKKSQLIHANDRIAIQIHSRDENLTKLFDLTTNTSQSRPDGACYSVQEDGTIDFPEIGKIDVAGKTREQVAKLIKSRLMADDLVRDPVVTVTFADLWVNVLGEVSSPGRKELQKDGESIIDIIAQCGDLTILAKRNNVKVMREENGALHTYTIDLTNASEMASSPAYYIQPNDIVYVEPSDYKKRQGTPSGNSLFTPSFWMSAASFVLGMVTMIVALNK